MKRRDLLRTMLGVGAMTSMRDSSDRVLHAQSTSSGGATRPSAGDLAGRLAESIQKHNVPGASAAVFRGGRWEIATAGVTNTTTGVDVTPETVMHIGSITKVLTATLVMQLVDEGLVQLDAPVRRYLPEFQLADRSAAERITVEMLLNHTSGIDGEYFPDAGPDAERIVDVVRLISGQGQIHAPGTETSYCNAGAVLAGYLAQRLVGKSWYTLVEERIFRPLDLRHSVVQPGDAVLHRASVGHFPGANGTNTRTSFAFLKAGFAPAGTTAMLSARDLATFALAHVNDGVSPNGHRLLSTASVRRMRSQIARWRGVGGEGFGLGWMIGDKGILTHDGGGPGIVSSLYVDPATRTVAVVLTNAAHGQTVVDNITAPLYQAAGAKPFQADALEREKHATDTRVDPQPYLGLYESAVLVFRVIPYENGIALRTRLKTRFYDSDTLEESPPVRLRPMGDDHFTSDERFVTFLNPGSDGRMQHLASRRRLHKRSG